MQLREPDFARLRDLYVDLEFHALAKNVGMLVQQQQQQDPAAVSATRVEVPIPKKAEYVIVDTVSKLAEVIEKARTAGVFALDTETAVDPDSPLQVDPLRSTLVSIAIAVAPGEAYYLPLRH
jgi:DNA polymerase-1